MQKKVLITGASGFVAEHLIPQFRKKGWFIYGTDRQDSPSVKCDVFKSIDLNDLKGADLEGESFDLVIHLAAARADWGVTDEEYFRDNVDASRALIEALKEIEVKKVIFVSSISVMPQDTNECLEEDAPYAPINAYGFSKRDAEYLFLDYHKEFKFDLSIIRPTVLYGPSNPEKTGIYRAVDNNIFRLIDGIYSKRFAILGDGKTIKTTAYVKNFIDAIIFSAENTKGYELYVYADYPPTFMVDLVKLIRSNLGKTGTGPRLPFKMIMNFSIIFDLFSKYTKINLPINQSRIKTFVRPTNFRPGNYIKKGFKQKYTTDKAIEETVEWYLDLKEKSDHNFFLFKEK